MSRLTDRTSSTVYVSRFFYRTLESVNQIFTISLGILLEQYVFNRIPHIKYFLQYDHIDWIC